MGLNLNPSSAPSTPAMGAAQPAATQPAAVQPAASGGIMSGLQNAKKSADTNYLSQGVYLLRVDKAKNFPNRQGIECSAFECTVVRAEAGSVHGPGDAVSIVTTKKSDFYDSDIVKFLEDGVGIPQQQLDAAAMTSIFGDQQILVGCVVETVATLVPLKANPEKMFTKVSYRGRWDSVRLEAEIDDNERRFFPNGTKPIIEG